MLTHQSTGSEKQTTDWVISFLVHVFIEGILFTIIIQRIILSL